MSVHDLLLALMLPSADDAAEDLAFNVGHGSVARFVGMMNAEARSWGCATRTTRRRSASTRRGTTRARRDLVKLADYDLRTQPYFARIVALPRAMLRSGSHVAHVVNRNDLVGRVPVDRRRQDGPYARMPVTCSSARAARRHDADQRRAREPSETSRDADTLALLGYGRRQLPAAHARAPGQLLARPAVKDRPGARRS